MEVTSGAEEGFIREWTPCSHILNLIPPRIQTGIFSNELCLTCVDAVSEYIALGTNVGLVYWYDRKKGNIQRLRCEASASPITCVRIASTVDYMVGAGNAAGQVTVFQIPKQHPDGVPDALKPKVEPKVERYTIGDLHKSQITAIEWSKNGMRLFSGDKNGVVIMTEIDFYMHLCKSLELVNERHEVVQLSHCRGALLVCTVYRSIVCERRDARWHVRQLGKKERRTLCALGGTFQYSYARGGGGGAAAAYCARPGLRLWRADAAGDVMHTLLFKDAISNPLTVAELLNPSQRGRGGGGGEGEAAGAERERRLGPLHVYREHFLVAHDDRSLYVLDPRSLTAVAVVDDLRRILSVSVNKDEIFVLEGPRSLVRLAHAPEPAALAPEEPSRLMSKSLSGSLQQAVLAVRDLAQPRYYAADVADTGAVASAEECFELPPVRPLPGGAPRAVLRSIVAEPPAADRLRDHLEVYDRLVEDELVLRSRRGRAAAPPPPPRRAPARDPCGASDMSGHAVTVYPDIQQESDDLLEKQIEEKEKILAKMLDLESLSIASAAPPPEPEPHPQPHAPRQPHVIPSRDQTHSEQYANDTDPVLPEKNTKIPENINYINKIKLTEQPSIVDLVPKVVKLPNNWNLENFELRLDMRNGLKNGGNGVTSPDDHLDSEWEVI